MYTQADARAFEKKMVPGTVGYQVENLALATSLLIQSSFYAYNKLNLGQVIILSILPPLFFFFCVIL